MIGLALLAPLAGCGGGSGPATSGSSDDNQSGSRLVIKPSGPRGSLAADVVAMGT
jgi:hypothetical protein